MKKLLERLREPLTSIIGLVIMLMTMAGIYKQMITWQWEGIIGLIIGAIFFLMPDKLVKIILDYGRKFLDKLLNKPPQE